MSRSHASLAAALFAAATLASQASGAVVVNMVDDGVDIRATVSGWFNVASNGGSTQYSADILKVDNNDFQFVQRPAGVTTVNLQTYTVDNVGFSGDFGGSSLSGAAVTNASMPIWIRGFGGGSWGIYADASATEANPYDWDLRWANSSIAAKGYNVGTYVWTLTDGTNTDSITLNIGSPSAVPGAGLASLATVGLAGVSRRRRR